MTDPTPSTPRSSSDARALLELGLTAETDEAELLDAVAGRLPGLDVLEVIGRGGMGVVYLARQESLGRLAAVKVLNPELARRPEFPVRFEQEARILASLEHPGIVEVYDVGEADGFFYIVMEYVAGASLREEMTEPMSVPRVRAIVQSVCAVLDHAHRQGIVHRDIKPENILVAPDGSLKVADFGLAKLTSGPNLSLTATLTAAGTLLYMAPEQLEGRGVVGPASDLYSVGVLAYELLTARLPVGRFGPPSEEGAANSELDAAVMACLEKDPARRIQTANALSVALDAAPVVSPVERSMAPIGGPSVHALPPTGSNHGRFWIGFMILFIVVFVGRALSLILFAASEQVTVAVIDEPPQQECMTAHGKTACGYHCEASFGQVACAAEPDMQCVAAFGDIACGYGCAEGFGKVACAPEPGMQCATASGDLRCGVGCRAERGGIVCEPPSVEAPAPARPPAAGPATPPRSPSIPASSIPVPPSPPPAP